MVEARVVCRRIATAVLIAFLGATPLVAQDYRYLTFEQITVANTAIGFTSAKVVEGGGHPQATSAYCRLETAEVRYTVDGTTPTSSVGTLLEPGDILSVSGPQPIQNFRAIRTTSTSGQLNCTYAGR